METKTYCVYYDLTTMRYAFYRDNIGSNIVRVQRGLADSHFRDRKQAQSRCDDLNAQEENR